MTINVSFSWKDEVRKSTCQPIKNLGRWLNPLHPKHVPGSYACQSAYLELEHVRVPPPPSVPPMKNCMMYSAGGFNCRDWGSPTLISDLDEAISFHRQKSDTETLDPKILGSRSSITIWSNTIQASNEIDLLGFWTLLPCVSRFSVSLDLFLKKTRTQCDECVLLHAVNMLRKCGNSIPLSEFRLALLEQGALYFKDAMTGMKAKEVLKRTFRGFKSGVQIIDSTTEKERVAISLSLLLSNMRSLDVEWTKASDQNQAFFDRLENVLESVQSASPKTVILDQSIAKNTQRAIEYVEAVKSINSETVIKVLETLMTQ